MFDFPNGPVPGTIFEPNGAGTDPSYTFDGVGWVYGATTNLLISSVIPNSAICGSVAIPAVRALGANFTATCEILIDGVAVVTTFVSVSELTFPVNPVPETVPKTVVITVRDGATLGAGAVPFNFTIVTTIDYRIGIDETSPGIVDLLPANTINEIGGVTVVPRSDVQGLALDLATGALTAPLATPLLAGALIEPPADSRGYVRQTTGAASSWVPPADTPLPDAGIGLTVDTTTPPGILNLDIANTNGEIGGVMTEPRTAIQGLDMTVTGLITVPLATPLLAGSITEPPAYLRGYVRQTTGAASSWVPPADTPTPDYGIGLTEDTTTTPTVVNLDIANTNGEIGGVMTVPRTDVQALDMAVDGLITVPLATPLLAGSIVEPPPDAKGYVRTTQTTGVSQWVPPATPAPAPLAIELIIPNTASVGQAPLTVEVHGTKFTATTTVIVDGAAKPTVFISPTELTFQIDPRLETIRGALVTVQDTVGPVNGLGDAPFFFIAPISLYRGIYSPINNTPDIWAGRQLGYMWIVDLVDPMVPEFSGVPGLAGIALNEGDHLVYDGTQYTVVDGNQTMSLYQGWWKPATNVPDIGTMVKYTGYMWIADTAVPNTPETPPLGLPGLDGVAIYEGDMILWDGAKFVLMQGVLVPNYRGLWNVASNTPPIDQPPVGNNKPNWMWIAKTVDPNVPEVAPATMPGIGGMTFREGDHAVWDKPTNAFIKVLGSGGAVNPAGATKPEIGVVFVPARTNMQALTLNVDGQLTSLLATPGLAGAILEPPADDKGYVRQTSSKGGSSWVPPALTPLPDWGIGLTGDMTTPPGIVNLDIANTNGEIGGVMTIGRGPTQGLDLDMGTGLLTAPLATDVAAGSIVEPPADGAIYSRQRTTAGVSAWVPGAAGVFIGDDPPPAPTAGMLWFESDTGDTHVWYADVDSGQWVQI